MKPLTEKALNNLAAQIYAKARRALPADAARGYFHLAPALQEPWRALATWHHAQMQRVAPPAAGPQSPAATTPPATAAAHKVSTLPELIAGTESALADLEREFSASGTDLQRPDLISLSLTLAHLRAAAWSLKQAAFHNKDIP